MTTSLSLYIHIPWCVRKCPYCDFNSHALAGELPHDDYVRALLDDLAADAADFDVGREAKSVFFGGGTPSLLSGDAVARLMHGIGQRLPLSPSAEVTLEANPGTIGGDTTKFAAFRAAGINRLSIGVQSFNDAGLAALGRIHTADHARAAFDAAREAGFDNINLDLMHGLPGQDVAAALDDLETAIALAPEHISWYQLTIEPNTVFYKHPPELPGEDTLWEIYETGMALLEACGYARYEISAFSREGRTCRHNLNYWQFGDYLGIGAGAHGKLTLTDRVVRTAKTRLPRDYLANAGRRETRVATSELPVEFLMNALRLTAGFSRARFHERTGHDPALLDDLLGRPAARQLVEMDASRIRPTRLGLQYLNTLLVMIMEDDDTIARS